jgi:hypothetical protein
VNGVDVGVGLDVAVGAEVEVRVGVGVVRRDVPSSPPSQPATMKSTAAARGSDGARHRRIM